MDGFKYWLLYSWGECSGWVGSTFGLHILENGKLIRVSRCVVIPEEFTVHFKCSIYSFILLSVL